LLDATITAVLRHSRNFLFGGSSVVPLAEAELAPGAAMSRSRITKRLVDGLEAGEREYFRWDSEMAGFGLRVQPSGAKSYVVKYRAGSGRSAPTRRVTIGAVGKLTPDQARTAAKKMLGAVAQGADPARERAAEKRSATLRELADLFLTEHMDAKRKASTAKLYRDILERLVLPKLGTRKAEKVTTGELARLHLDMRDHPYQANRMLAVVGSLYSFAVRRKILPFGTNPVRGIEKYPERGRERFLSVLELARVGDAIREAETTGIPYVVDETKPKAKHAPKPKNRRTIIDPHGAAALRLLIFTGARLREILHLRWEWVDLERGLLLLPDSKTGKKAIVLNAPAMKVLADLPRMGAHVIAGKVAGTDGERPRSDLNRPWRAVAKCAGLRGVRIHDLRHTHASFGAGAGLGLPIIGKLLGHAHATTTARYAHLDIDPLRRASEHIGSRLAEAMGEAASDITSDVVALNRRAASQR
jgi:integrase